jgi:dTDP-4-amino-4,6-dideoxygalactose transaminase
VKLRHLAAGNERRRAHAARYRAALSEAKLRLPVERPGARHVYHQFVIQSDRRDALREHLARADVAALVHYPLALQEVEALRTRVVFREAPRRAAEAARTILSLPIYPELPAAHQQQVIESVLAFH